MSNHITPINPSITPPERSTPSRPPSAIRQTLSRLCFWRGAPSTEPVSFFSDTIPVFSNLSSPASQLVSPRASSAFSKNPLFSEEDDFDIGEVPKEGYVDALPPTEEEKEKLPQIMQEVAEVAKARLAFIQACAKPPTPPPRKKASEQPLPPIPAQEPIYNEHIYAKIDETIKTSTRTASPQTEIKHPSPKRPRPNDPTPEHIERLSQTPPLNFSLAASHHASLFTTAERSVRRRLFDTKASQVLFDHSQV